MEESFCYDEEKVECVIRKGKNPACWDSDIYSILRNSAKAEGVCGGVDCDFGDDI